MSLQKEKILIFVADGYEDMELQYPKYRMQEAQAKVVIAGETENKIYSGKHGVPCRAEIDFDHVHVKDFTALIIPGGQAPDKLRTNLRVLSLTQQFYKEQKLIAFICHAGWVPISANIIKGVKCTSVAAIKDDLINAGAKWVDEPVVVDKHFISSRTPEDLPKFCPAIIEFLSKKK